MAIRIRSTGSGYIALCAAKSKALNGDIYLNDGIHTALTTKFRKDFISEGLIFPPSEITEEEIVRLVAENTKGISNNDERSICAYYLRMGLEHKQQPH